MRRTRYHHGAQPWPSIVPAFVLPTIVTAIAAAFTVMVLVNGMVSSEKG